MSSPFNREFQSVLERLRESGGRCSLLSHVNPDPDALGSELGLMHILEDAGIQCAPRNESGVSESLSYFPGSHRISSAPFDESIPCLVLDCGALERVGDSYIAAVSRSALTINIDHHISNSRFGTINIVDAAASSTSEMVYEFASANGLSISKDAAHCLFAGISGDTGSFKYSSTSARVFEIAGSLVQAGASPQVIAQSLYGQSNPAAVKLQADALLRAQYFSDGKAIFGSVNEEDYLRCGATSDETEGLVERLRDIRGVEIAALAKWDGAVWRVSLRSRNAQFDVNQIAQTFGGGGHIMAAAFRWKREFSELQEKLIGVISGVITNATPPAAATGNGK